MVDNDNLEQEEQGQEENGAIPQEDSATTDDGTSGEDEGTPAQEPTETPEAGAEGEGEDRKEPGTQDDYSDQEKAEIEKWMTKMNLPEGVT